MSIDILGYLVAIVSGMPFETFLKTRIFEPLGMNDTGFSVRVENADRYSKVYEFGEAGELQAIEKVHAATGPLTFFHSGGGGLLSTAPDYLRFCQMVLNDGELDGVRLLGKKTSELIRMNHVPPDWLTPGRTGVGFGLGFSVVTDVAETHTLGSVGTCSWGGMASTTFWIDPVEELIGVFMTQLVGADSPFHAQFRVPDLSGTDGIVAVGCRQSAISECLRGYFQTSMRNQSEQEYPKYVRSHEGLFTDG